MATAGCQQFTDEAILYELHKLGLDDVSPEQFQQIKEDVSAMIQHRIETSNPPAELLPLIDDNYDTQKLMQRSCPLSSAGSSSLSNASSHSAISITPDPEVEERHRSRFQNFLERKSSTTKNQRSSSSLSVPSDKENEFLDVRISMGKKQHTIKRKVLRLIDGKKVLTEEERPLPNFTSVEIDWNSNPLRAKSSSSDELWRRQSQSSVSISSRSSSSSSSSGKNRSSSRQSGVIVPNLNMRRKKCDPVTKYHEYKKYWDTFKLPGENKHSRLRWTVREQMLDYNFC